LVLFFLAFGVAAVCIFLKPLPIKPSYESYDLLAWNIVRGHGYSWSYGPYLRPELFRTPGYPLFLVPFYWMFGRAYEGVYWAQAVLHAAVPVFIFSMVCRVFSRPAALWAGLCVALYPLTAVYVPTILAESVSVFVTVWTVWFFLRTMDRPTAWRAAQLGALFAFGALLRPAMALFSLFLFLGAWAATRRARTLLLPFCVAHLAFAAVMAPWVIRNHQVSGEFIPLSNESSLQLWLATLNYGPYTDRYWQHPLYKVENQFEVKRSGLFFDRDRAPYPVEIRVHRVELLRPLKLHYQVNGQGPFQIIPMRQTGPRRLRAEIPPQTWGSVVRYFMSARNPWESGPRIRIPANSDGGFLYYRVTRSLLDNLGDEVIDLNFLSRQAEALSGRVILKPREESALDLDGDGRLTEADLRRTLSLLGGTRFAPAIGLHAEGKHVLTISFSDGRLDVPSVRAGGSVLSDLMWKKLSPRAVALLVAVGRKSKRGRRMGWRKPTVERLFQCPFELTNSLADGYLLKPVPATLSARSEVPCIWEAGIEPVARELKRFRVYKNYFQENFRRMPMEFFGGSLLRMFRVWVIVGQAKVAGQTYNISGADWIYPALTVLTIALLVMAAAGFAVVWRRWRSHWYLAAPVIYVSVIHAPFHPEARYSLSARPFLLVYCALALFALWRHWRGGQPGFETSQGDPPSGAAA
jgi:hypothetical protein